MGKKDKESKEKKEKKSKDKKEKKSKKEDSPKPKATKKKEEDKKPAAGDKKQAAVTGKAPHYKASAAEMKRRVEERRDGPNPLQLPTGERDLLACRSCHRILTQQQFLQEGCTGCDGDSAYRMTHPEVKEKTTTNFFGHVGIFDPRRSWIARLIEVEDKPPGVYAARVGNPTPAGGATERVPERQLD
jgi:transcription elongation factor SPT4